MILKALVIPLSDVSSTPKMQKKLILITDVEMEKPLLITDFSLIKKLQQKITTSPFNVGTEISLLVTIYLVKLK